MSSKTRTDTTRTTNTTGSGRAPRSVPDQDTAAKARTDTEDKLWRALQANPNNTVPFLAGVANIGKSTAAKFLAKWAKDGSVTRIPGIAEGGRRAADLWAITDTDPAGVPVGDVSSVDPEQASVTVPESAGVAPADDGPAEPTATAADHAPTPADIGATDLAQAESVVAESTPSAAARSVTDGDTATGSGGGKKTRLAPGTLRGMVEDHLRDHPGEAFGPTAIATALGGKSSGAVSNALDKLVAAGTAVQTQESPKRFALASERPAAAFAATK